MIFKILYISLILYVVIVVSILLFKKSTGINSSDIITIPAPHEEGKKKLTDELKFDKFNFDPLFKEICAFILNHPEDPRKIVKFIRESLNEEEKKELLLCIKYNNKQLYNQVISLQTINLENIEGFQSTPIDIEDDSITVTIDTEIYAQGGVPITYFIEQCEKMIESSTQMEVYSIFANINETYEKLTDQTKEEISTSIAAFCPLKKKKGINRAEINRAEKIGQTVSEEFYKELIKLQNNNLAE